MEKIIAMYAMIVIVLVMSGCSNNNPDPNTVLNNSLDNNDIDDMFTYEEGKVKVYFFWGDGCPHCKTQMQFFESIESNYPEMEIYMFETYRNQSNVRLFQQISAKYGATPRGVPATFIGDKMWVGFSNIIGNEVEQKIEYCLTNECNLPE